MPPYRELDPTTLRRARAGKRSAQAALVRCYKARVHALVARVLVAAPCDVDDVVQDTFVRAIRALSRYRPEARLSTWLLTIATRASLDQLRRNRRSWHREHESEAADPRLDARIDAARLHDRVVAEMAALPDDQRAALVLRAFHDLDYPEIAAALGVEVGTVKSRIGRARAALRRATQEPVHD